MFAIYAIPLVGERFLAKRRASTSVRERVIETLKLCGVDPGTVPSTVIDRSVTLLDERADVEGMDKAFLAAARSLVKLLVDPRRYRKAMSSLQLPVLLVHGDRDRLVPVAAARDIARRHPAWRYLELAGVGHVPQLQKAEEVAAAMVGWLAEIQETRSPS
jgi:pimeloyl-ACP methyl ester carboxylesterase